jgi:hypothetical protein
MGRWDNDTILRAGELEAIHEPLNMGKHTSYFSMVIIFANVTHEITKGILMEVPYHGGPREGLLQFDFQSDDFLRLCHDAAA